VSPLDTRLRAGEVITDRERYLLGVIRYLDDMDGWYLDEAADMVAVLRGDFGFVRPGEEP